MISELKCISSDSDKLVKNNNGSVIITVIDDDDTIKREKTLIAPDASSDSKEESVNQETTRSEESGESSRYETISETYCADELSNVSSISFIPLDSSDESVRLHQLTDEGDSVVFVSETFPSKLQNCHSFDKITFPSFSRIKRCKHSIIYTEGKFKFNISPHIADSRRCFHDTESKESH